MNRSLLDVPFNSSLFRIAAFAACAALIACGGSDGANNDMGGGDGLVSDHMMKVNGKVLDRKGLPIGGVAIKIDEAFTLSALDGTFSIPTATVPYRLLVGGHLPGGYRSVVVYDQLSRLDPTLRLYDADVERDYTYYYSSVSGSPSGSFSGITSPLTTGQYGWLTSDISDEVKFYSAGNTLTISNYNVYWKNTGKTAMTTLRALFWSGSGDSTNYLGAGKLAVMLEDGKTLTLDPIALAAPKEGTISGTLTLPASASSASITPWVRYSDRSTISLSRVFNVDRSFTMKSAAIDGATFELEFQSDVGDRSSIVVVHGLASGATIPAFTMPSPTALVQPINASTGVTATTDFQIMPGSTGLVHWVHFKSGSTTWTLVTTSSTFHLPDGTSLGVPMPTLGEKVYWQVKSVTAANIDAFAGAKDLLDARSAVPAGTPYPWSESEEYLFQM